MNLKIMFKGSLQFKDERSYNFAVEEYTTRALAGFTSDVLFAPEICFDAEAMTFKIPKLTSPGSDRTYRCTKEAILVVAKYAIAGFIQSWAKEGDHLKDYCVYEPNSEKTEVQVYRLGRDLVRVKGKEVEAEEALNSAIERFKQHAMAYAWRGYIKLQLKDYKSAGEDFSLSIDINAENPDPYYGRAKVYRIHNQWEKALDDLNMVIKHSIPLETIFWRARLRKGESLFHLKRFSEAEAEFTAYVKRGFEPNDPNNYKLRKAYLILGRTLVELGKNAEAIAMFTKAEETKTGEEHWPTCEILFNRGVAKKNAGKNGYLKDIKEAAKQGSEAAALWLTTMG